MPHYFFHVRNRFGYVEDEEGSELPDLEAARARAIDGVRSMLSEEARAGEIDLRGRIEVRDPAGALLLTIPFAEAVTVHTGPPADGSKPGIAA
ncbi:DUF6894 family protein [Sphingosinicella terrae]|uniref:DUF6894 family protein n=1 Tax=Sphingosinicella terrae TaxID=2172047 RepID=UPI000E0D7B0D|nr:hypothetical protein [Sphingosinicella terrae]